MNGDVPHWECIYSPGMHIVYTGCEVINRMITGSSYLRTSITINSRSGRSLLFWSRSLLLSNRSYCFHSGAIVCDEMGIVVLVGKPSLALSRHEYSLMTLQVGKSLI